MPACSAYSLPDARAPLVPRAACMVGNSKSLRCAKVEEAQSRIKSGRASLCFIASLIIALGLGVGDYGLGRVDRRLEMTIVPVFREKIGCPAVGAAIHPREKSPSHQLHLVQPFRLRARTAADADVGPGIDVDWNGEASEIERPAVDAEPGAKKPVRQPRREGEHMQRSLGAIANRQQTPWTG